MAARFLRGLIQLIPYFALSAVAAWQWAAIRAQCEGMFVYTLDDPNIHLALAERIAGGWYGINPGEPSAPSSSVLWSFLLAPFASASFFAFVPLALNLAAAAGCLYVYGKIIDLALANSSNVVPLPSSMRKKARVQLLPFPQEIARTAIICLLVMATNLSGLSFTGMEHVVQVWLCAILVYGAALTLQHRTVPKWLAVVCVLAPLIRYECLAVAAPVLVLLILLGHWKPAASAFIGIVITLGGYSLFLMKLGIGWLPTSVLAKAEVFGPLSEESLFPSLFGHMQENITEDLGKFLAFCGAALVFTAIGGLVTTRKVRNFSTMVAIFGAVTVLFHLAFGQFGWWDRYEVYAITVAILSLMLALRRPFRWMFRQSLLLFLFGMIFMLWTPVNQYWTNLQKTPLAAANIYEQQYQIHRFTVDYLRGPIAVNDFGWASFRNPYPVLDLWGLASPEALRLRSKMVQQNTSPEWMDRLARERNVEVVMIYDHWLPHPTNWQRVGKLHLGGPQASAGESVVSFYVIDPSRRDEILRLLEEFRATLPEGVLLEVEPTGHPSGSF